jgi:hypothetical protein
MNTLHKRLAAACSSLGLVIALSLSPSASATTLHGALFDLSYDASELGLFGTPSVFGDAIFFLPSAWQAVSTQDDTVTLASSVSLQISAHDGYTISTLGALELGRYLLEGDRSFVMPVGALTMNDLSASAPGFVRSITPLAPLEDRDGSLHRWAAGTMVDLPADAGWSATTQLSVTLDTQLLAFASQSSATPGVALTDARFAALFLGFQAVPVPELSGAWMWACGLGVLGVIRKRRVHAA